jgi:hypothetical protein
VTSLQQYLLVQQQAALQQRLVAQILNEMMRATEPVLRQGLKHSQPLYRVASALVIGQRKLKMTGELIGLLADADEEVLVQQAARRSLILLSKQYGQAQDFGPLPGCACEQREEAATLWRDWWDQRQKVKTVASW